MTGLGLQVPATQGWKKERRIMAAHYLPPGVGQMWGQSRFSEKKSGSYGTSCTEHANGGERALLEVGTPYRVFRYIGWDGRDTGDAWRRIHRMERTGLRQGIVQVRRIRFMGAMGCQVSVVCYGWRDGRGSCARAGRLP